MNFTEKAKQISEALVDSGCAFGQGVDDADDEAQWIIYAGLGLDIASEIAQDIDRSSQKLKSGEISAINRLLDERITTRRPLAYRHSGRQL